MIQKPQLKTFLSLFPVSPTEWGVRGGPEEVWRLKLPSDGIVQAFCAILPYLDGTRTREEIAKLVSEDGATADTHLELLDSLETHGLIEEANHEGLSEDDYHRYSEQVSFFSRFTTRGGAGYQSRLIASKAAVIGAGELSRCVCRQLKEAGIGNVAQLVSSDAQGGQMHLNADRAADPSHDVLRIPESDAPWPESLTPYPDLFVFAEQWYDPSGLTAMDGFAKRHGVPWLLVRATDVHEATVGPLFIPGETASYASLEARLRSNAVHYDQYVAFESHLREHPNLALSTGGLRASFDLLGSIAVIEAVKFLSGVLLPALAGRMITVNIVSWESELHDVLKVPRLERGFESPHEAFPWKYDADK